MRERTQLYLITPPDATFPAFTDTVKSAFDGGQVAALQIRLKDENYVAHPEAEQIAAIEALKPLCQEYGVALFLNDLPQLAKEYELDGVHVGADDMGVKQVRSLVGEDMLIGASCYASKDRAFLAGEQGADYVAFGQFYETSTKPAKGRPDLEFLEFWQSYATIPCAAIGGIKVDNCEPLVRAGADFIAVVTGVWNFDKGPTQAVTDFNAAIDRVFASL